MIHIAILKPGYIKMILDGRKTMESRLTKTMQPPHGKIEAGERLFLKASGGPFMATAIAGEVQSFEDLASKDLTRMRKRHNQAICGDDTYWELKKESRFATLIELKQVEPIEVGPKYKVAYMKAWYVLDEALSPLRDWVITAGALRNHYACLPKPPGAKPRPEQAITLVLPDGSQIDTELAAGQRLRWRGWSSIYESAAANAGDKLRFTATGPRRYAVRVVRG